MQDAEKPAVAEIVGRPCLPRIVCRHHPRRRHGIFDLVRAEKPAGEIYVGDGLALTSRIGMAHELNLNIGRTVGCAQQQVNLHVDELGVLSGQITHC